MKTRLLNILISIRMKLLKILIEKMGFQNISNHWVYPEHIREGNVVLDLGANLGVFSLQMKNNFKTQNILVEPNPYLYELLLKDFNALNVAMSDEDGQKEFYISNNIEASSLNSIINHSWGIKEKYTVEVVSWKSLLKKNVMLEKDIEVLKIDIEGSEIDLIQAFTENDTERINQMTVEFHDWLMPGLKKATRRGLQKMVEEHKYVVISNSPSSDWPLEILFIKEKYLDFGFYKKCLFFLYRKIAFKYY